MSIPVLGVTYSRVSPSIDWTYPGLPTLPGIESRYDLDWGTYIPSRYTTGITSTASSLEVVEQDTTFGPPYTGATIRGKRFRGQVVIAAPGITFENCFFEGRSTRGVNNVIVLVASNSAKDIVFNDCTFRPRYVDAYQHVISGHDFTLRRCDISGGVDGVSAIAGGSGRVDILIEACWIHDLAFFSPAPHGDNMTHNDLIQWHGGPGLTVRGNLLEGYLDPTLGDVDKPWANGAGNYWAASRLTGRKRALSIVMISPGNGSHKEFVFEKNWANGGAVGINADGASADFLTHDGSHISENWFGLDFRLVEDRNLTYTVENSFAVYLKSAHVIPVQDNWLWIEDDPLQTEIPNNTRKNNG